MQEDGKYAWKAGEKKGLKKLKIKRAEDDFWEKLKDIDIDKAVQIKVKVMRRNFKTTFKEAEDVYGTVRIGFNKKRETRLNEYVRNLVKIIWKENLNDLKIMVTNEKIMNLYNVLNN